MNEHCIAFGDQLNQVNMFRLEITIHSRLLDDLNFYLKVQYLEQILIHITFHVQDFQNPYHFALCPWKIHLPFQVIIIVDMKLDLGPCT